MKQEANSCYTTIHTKLSSFGQLVARRSLTVTELFCIRSFLCPRDLSARNCPRRFPSPRSRAVQSACGYATASQSRRLATRCRVVLQVIHVLSWCAFIPRASPRVHVLLPSIRRLARRRISRRGGIRARRSPRVEIQRRGDAADDAQRLERPRGCASECSTGEIVFVNRMRAVQVHHGEFACRRVTASDGASRASVVTRTRGCFSSAGRGPVVGHRRSRGATASSASVDALARASERRRARVRA